MTFTTSNVEYTIDMKAKEVEAREAGRQHFYGFDHFNAEDCETAEDVKEMILEHLEETAA